MDILYWKQLSKSILTANTTKRFYGTYLYKMVLHAPGCKSMADSNIASSLNTRLQYNRIVNYGGSWHSTRDIKFAKDADVAWLQLLQNIKLSNTQIKVRCEEPKVQIYAVDENQIKSIVSQLTEYSHNILEIYGPENDEAKKLLEENKTIVVKKPKYQWKINFSEKRCDMALRLNILNYLQQLDDLVKIPKSTVEQLSRKNDWLWGCYIYTNDIGIADMLRLIYPDLIREVSEQVQVDNK